MVGRRYLPSIRTLHVVQSPLQRWARDRHTSREMNRPLHGACHTMRGLDRSCSVHRHNPTPDACSLEIPTAFPSKWRPLSETSFRGKYDEEVELGHRSPAPATFFEVRFAGLFETRRRLSTSATKHDERARPSSERSSLDEGRNLLPALATAFTGYVKRLRGASHAHPVMAPRRRFPLLAQDFDDDTFTAVGVTRQIRCRRIGTQRMARAERPSEGRATMTR